MISSAELLRVAASRRGRACSPPLADWGKLSPRGAIGGGAGQAQPLRLGRLGAIGGGAGQAQPLRLGRLGAIGGGAGQAQPLQSFRIVSPALRVLHNVFANQLQFMRIANDVLVKILLERTCPWLRHEFIQRDGANGFKSSDDVPHAGPTPRRPAARRLPGAGFRHANRLGARRVRRWGQGKPSPYDPSVDDSLRILPMGIIPVCSTHIIDRELVAQRMCPWPEPTPVIILVRAKQKRRANGWASFEMRRAPSRETCSAKLCQIR